MPCGLFEQSTAKCDRKICQTMFCRENAADLRERCVIRTFHQKSKLEPCGFCVWNTVLSCCLILLCCHCDISAFPAKREGDFATRGKRQINDVNVHSYLMSFGYLPQSDFETGNLRSDDQLKDALRTLQIFGNIPATGKMDEATKRLLRKPRCGLPDISTTQYRSKRYTLNGQRWHHTNLTWSLQTQNPRNLDGGLVRAELHRALDVWAQHSKLTFREINSDRADILIYFHTRYHGDGYAFDGRGQILAHAFFPGSGRGGDAHFDEDEIWTLQHQNDVDGTSLFAVAAHEFGHSLGLSHSSVEGALMYPWYQGLKADFQLPDDDRHGIQQIYGTKEGKLWGKIPAYDPVEPPRTPRPTKPPQTRPTTTTIPPTKQTQPPPPPKHPPKKYPAAADKPDTCDTSYDAISVIRREVFIFKGRFLWRVGEAGLYDGYPAEIGRLWYNLPKNLTHVDAVYERLDTKIMFFVGRQYFLYGGNQLEAGYPRAITDLGLPDTLDHVDAAMVWGHNKKTYLFSGTMYWRFDEEVGKVELDYPRDMSMWKGVGYGIDTVFQWKDGKTYFFKGKGYWKFNDLRMQVENEKQSPSAPFWMGCPRELENPIDANEREQFTQTSATSNPAPSIIMLALAFFVKFSHL